MRRTGSARATALAVALVIGWGWADSAAMAETPPEVTPGTAAELGEPVATDPPAGDPPATEAPSDPPATGTPTPPPTEAPPASEPPTPTEAPSEPPATESPATEAPATEAPATEAPATEAPATEAPATEAPATEAPAPSVRSFAVTQGEATVKSFPSGALRLAGADRYGTAVAVSQRFEPGVEVVYLATGADFPDALAAAAAAAAVGGPVLLTRGDALPSAVRAEIVRLSPARIVVVGGEAVVGRAVFTAVQRLAPKVVRIGGANRYETAERIVANAFPAATQAFVATGRTYADALAASAAAGANGIPVLLVDGVASKVRSGTISTLRALGVKTVRIAGGTAVVTSNISSGFANAGFTVRRHAGADRYLTAEAVNDAVFGDLTVKTVFVATGFDFADALAGSALAGSTGSPLYLSRPSCIPPLIASAISERDPSTRVILGGTGALAETVARGTACQLAWAKPASGRITDGFGPRTPFCTPGGCTGSFHRGVDLDTGCRANIYAAATGRVTIAGVYGTYGNFIKIQHGAGIDTAYAHLVNGGILVKVGQIVQKGQRIGLTGSTGASTGCHLHFEVYRNGAQIDPVPFLEVRGIRLG